MVAALANGRLRAIPRNTGFSSMLRWPPSVRRTRDALWPFIPVAKRRFSPSHSRKRMSTVTKAALDANKKEGGAAVSQFLLLLLLLLHVAGSSVWQWNLAQSLRRDAPNEVDEADQQRNRFVQYRLSIPDLVSSEFSLGPDHDQNVTYNFLGPVVFSESPRARERSSPRHAPVSGSQHRRSNTHCSRGPCCVRTHLKCSATWHARPRARSIHPPRGMLPKGSDDFGRSWECRNTWPPRSGESRPG
jgi:hypothetical protein